MKLEKKDWFLIAAWTAYLAFVGPWLISAPSWIAVGLGVVLFIGLVILTTKRLSKNDEV